MRTGVWSLAKGALLSLLICSGAFAECPDKATASNMIKSIMGGDIQVQEVKPDPDFKGVCEVTFVRAPQTRRTITAYLPGDGNSNALILGRKVSPGRTPARSVPPSENTVSPELVKQMKGYAYATYGSGQREWLLLLPFDCQGDCKTIYQKAVELFSKDRGKQEKLYVVVVPFDSGDSSQSDALVQFYCEKAGSPKGTYCQSGKVSVNVIKSAFAAMKLSKPLPALISSNGDVVYLRTVNDLTGTLR